MAVFPTDRITDAQLNEPRFEYFDILLLGTEPVSEANLPNVKSYACNSFKLCKNDVWLHFLLCVANSQWSSVQGLNCNGVPDINSCNFSESATCPAS